MASEILQHILGADQWKPEQIWHEGVSHWYLRHRETGEVLDPTAHQFQTAVSYDKGRGRGFLTKDMSKDAQEHFRRIKDV